MFDAIAARSAETGMPAYLVGGAVRDWLLGAEGIDDLDFSVEGDAPAFARGLQQRHGGELLVHDKFSTARWLWQGESVDIAMARAEHYARPAALPEVAPASIEVDLRRRDFAANAIACRLFDGALIDPFDGQGDVRARRLRGLHGQSFVDDPTRMMRGARYAARLGFAFDEGTLAAIQLGVPHVRALSGERVKYDMELIFQDREPARALAHVREWGVFGALGIPTPEPDKLTARFERIRDAFVQGDFPLDTLDLTPAQLLSAAGWGALMYNQGQLPISRWMQIVPFEHQLRDALVSLGALSTLSSQIFQVRTSKQAALLSEFNGLALLLGYLFDPSTLKRRAMHCQWKDWRWVRPAITGDDLKEMGVPPGPRYKQLLDALRNAWLDREVESLEQERALLERLLREN